MNAPANIQPAKQPEWRNWGPAVIVGAIAGMDNIGSGLAIASLLFAGTLSVGLGPGVSLILLGSGILALVVALRSTQSNSIALVQETSVAILAAAIAVMAVRMQGPIEAKVATAIAIIGTASVVAGILFWVCGRLRLGTLARFLPYPVVAGFLAGSGWLLVAGAMAMLTDGLTTGLSDGLFSDGSLDALMAGLGDADMLSRIAPAVGFAIVMRTALRRYRHPATVPVVMVSAGILFYIVLWSTGTDIEAARSHGHLPQSPGPDEKALSTMAMVALVNWTEVFAAMPSILSAAALSMIGLLLNVSGLELATGRDIDANAELRASGIANLLSGGVGGPSGYVGISICLLADQIGSRGRRAGIATAIFMFVGVLAAKPMIAHMPIFLTAGFVLFLGIELLNEWLVSTRRQLPIEEWLIVFVILSVVALVGFIEGLAVGVIVSAAVFVFNYSRLPVVRLSASGTEQRSSVDRSPGAMKHLSKHGDAVAVVQLQGFLFFGTADRIVDHVRQRLSEPDRIPLRFLILDFRHVSGVDSAATTCFTKIRGMTGPGTVKVFFTDVSSEVERALRQAGFRFGDGSSMILESDIDHALEQIEDELLSSEPELDASNNLLNHLTAAIGPNKLLPKLIASMSRLSLEPGETLITAGDKANDIFFVARGRVRVQVTLADGRTLRLRTMTGGAIVGEIALYLHQERTADVIVERPSEIFRLGAEELERLERDDCEVAVLAHRVLAGNLSEKLNVANRMIRLAQR